MNAAEFEQRYRLAGDPWGYRSSDYERAKYDATLRACGPGPFASALELGGSIGVFSARLAARCRALTTVDFSPTAVRAARAQLAGYRQARPILGEIPDAIPDDSYDLVVASEILYYLRPGALTATFGRLEQVLATGGRLVAVHWRRPGRERPHTAAAVHDHMRALPWLREVDDGCTDDYLLHGFDLMNDPYGLLIIGGGPAGLAAARAYRELERARPLAIVADEQRMPYERPPLTKELLRGETSPSELPIEAESWLQRNAVDLIGGRVVSLDAGKRAATLSGGRELRYACCLLATGAEPARLPIPGADHPRVAVVRTLDHVRELTGRLHDGDRVTVIGSGFIGCEIAASLRIRGHHVTLVSDESAPNEARLGDEAAAVIGGWLADDGVRLLLGTPVDRIEHRDAGATVVVDSRRVESELVVMAVGVSPRSELGLQAGLELDGGAVPVDAAMGTERNGLLAAGDVCKAYNRAAGRALRVEHWGDALGQGEIAGRTAAGDDTGWESVPGFWSTIGRHTLKYAAWGDGYERSRLTRHEGGGFTAWYGSSGSLVGVLAYEADDDYERGSRLIAEGAPWES